MISIIILKFTKTMFKAVVEKSVQYLFIVITEWIFIQNFEKGCGTKNIFQNFISIFYDKNAIL